MMYNYPGVRFNTGELNVLRANFKLNVCLFGVMSVFS